MRCPVAPERDAGSVHYTDSTISAVHCRIYRKRGGWFLEDCSSNGTYLNDTKLGKGNSAKLSHKDAFSLLKPMGGPDQPPYAYAVTFPGESAGRGRQPVDASAPPVLTSEEAIRMAMDQMPASRRPALANGVSSGPFALTMDFGDEYEAGVAAATPVRSTPSPMAVMTAANGSSQRSAPRELAGEGVSEGAVGLVSAGEAERVRAAVERAVEDANRQADQVRMQAVETAAQAVAAHWKATLESREAELAEAAAAERKAAVEEAVAQIRQDAGPAIDKAVRAATEIVAKEAEAQQAKAVAEAIAAASERCKQEQQAAVRAAQHAAELKLTAALGLAREEAASETAAMLEAKERERHAERIAIAAEADARVRVEVDKAWEATRLEAGVGTLAAVEAAKAELRQQHEQALKHHADAAERATRLAVSQAEENTLNELSRQERQIREEMSREASLR